MKIDAVNYGGFPGHIDASPGSGISTSWGTPQRKWFSGYDSRMLFSHDGFIFIHHPCHDLRCRVNVRRRDVFGYPQCSCNGADISTGKTFFFIFRKLLGVANYSALATSQGNIHHRGFPCHPGGKCPYGINGFVRMPSDASLGRPARGIVSNPECVKNLCKTVVHFHRKSYFQLLHWPTQQFVHGRVQPQLAGCIVKLLLGDFKGIQ